MDNDDQFDDDDEDLEATQAVRKERLPSQQADPGAATLRQALL